MDGDGGEKKARVFSISEYTSNAGLVVAHAKSHGCAVVVDEAGRTEFVVNIPQHNLPGFDEQED